MKEEAKIFITTLIKSKRKILFHVEKHCVPNLEVGNEEGCVLKEEAKIFITTLINNKRKYYSMLRSIAGLSKKSLYIVAAGFMPANNDFWTAPREGCFEGRGEDFHNDIDKE